MKVISQSCVSRQIKERVEHQDLQSSVLSDSLENKMTPQEVGGQNMTNTSVIVEFVSEWLGQSETRKRPDETAE